MSIDGYNPYLTACADFSLKSVVCLLMWLPWDQKENFYNPRLFLDKLVPGPGSIMDFFFFLRSGEKCVKAMFRYRMAIILSPVYLFSFLPFD